MKLEQFNLTSWSKGDKISIEGNIYDVEGINFELSTIGFFIPIGDGDRRMQWISYEHCMKIQQE